MPIYDKHLQIHYIIVTCIHMLYIYIYRPTNIHAHMNILAQVINVLNYVILLHVQAPNVE